VIADVNAAVREANEDNNTRATGVLSIVRSDLTVPSVTFTPLAVAPGQNVSVTHTVKNVARAPGSALASQSHLYLTTISASIGSLIADFGLAAVPPIPPLTSKPVTSKVTIPANTPPGLYFFTVAADASPSIQEQDESNNIGSSATRLLVGPDILVTAASTTTGASPGQSITIGYTVKNQGGQATGAFDVGFALVLETGGPEVRLAATRSGITLGPASVLSSTTIITIPGDTAPGAYRIRVIGDVNAAVNEADEGNNTRLTGVLNIAPRQ
jgi:subtilase family serine protease